MMGSQPIKRHWDRLTRSNRFFLDSPRLFLLVLIESVFVVAVSFGLLRLVRHGLIALTTITDSTPLLLAGLLIGFLVAWLGAVVSVVLATAVVTAYTHMALQHPDPRVTAAMWRVMRLTPTLTQHALLYPVALGLSLTGISSNVIRKVFGYLPRSSIVLGTPAIVIEEVGITDAYLQSRTIMAWLTPYDARLSFGARSIVFSIGFAVIGLPISILALGSVLLSQVGLGTVHPRDLIFIETGTTTALVAVGFMVCYMLATSYEAVARTAFYHSRTGLPQGIHFGSEQFAGAIQPSYTCLFEPVVTIVHWVDLLRDRVPSR